MHVKEIANSFINLLFPENITCSICKDEVFDEKLVCINCYNKLPFISKACLKCGCNIQSGEYCIRCKNTSFVFDCCFSVCDYDDFVKNIVFRFKNDHRYLYEFMASLMAKKIKESGFIFDYITCVPITKKIEKARGYNQSFLLMKSIAKSLNINVLHGNFIKVKETQFQKNITAVARRKNVENAFALTDKNPIKRKNILIIDDIITTGSTLNECAGVFYKAKANAVVCATFAAVSPKISMEMSL